jgi:hypothetical protein
MLPDSDLLLRFEKETLRTILATDQFPALAPEIHASAKRALDGMQRRTRGRVVDFHTSLIMDLGMGHEGSKSPLRRVDLGACVDVGSKGVTNSSYQLTLCVNTSLPSPILRKVHFDFEHPGETNPRDRKPLYHLQVGGKLGNQLEKQGYIKADLDVVHPWCEKPRIPCFPPSLAMLLHWFLLEFRGNQLVLDVLNTPEWKKLVRTVERQYLGPIVTEFGKNLSSADDKVSFLRNHFYAIGT